MKPVSFKEQNCIYAKDQAGYLPLPAYKSDDGIVISCWGMTFKERIALFFRGKVFVATMTFNNPLQPQRVFIDAKSVLNELKGGNRE